MKKIICEKCRSTDITVTVTVNPNDQTTIADYCRRDESITEEGWCNLCNEQVALKTIDDGNHNPWRCKECGSLNIQQKVWADANTGEITDWESVEDDDCRCLDCGANTEHVEEEELMQTIIKWWGEADFRALERITGYRQLDFDPEDGYQAFVGACNEWWGNKTTDKKISIRREMTREQSNDN